MTDDAFGAVKGGVLRLRGRLHPAIHGNDTQYRHLALSRKTIRTDRLPAGRVENEIFSDSKSVSASDNLCCMPIVAQKIVGPVVFSSLILKPSDSDEMYERVGLLKTMYYPNEYPDHISTHISDSPPYQEESRYPEQGITVV